MSRDVVRPRHMPLDARVITTTAVIAGGRLVKPDTDRGAAIIAAPRPDQLPVMVSP
jgi:hypothetical protein